MLPGKELLNLDELLLFMHGLYLSKDTMFDPVVRLRGTILLYKIGEIHLLGYYICHFLPVKGYYARLNDNIHTHALCNQHKMKT